MRVLVTYLLAFFVLFHGCVINTYDVYNDFHHINSLLTVHNQTVEMFPLFVLLALLLTLKMYSICLIVKEC